MTAVRVAVVGVGGMGANHARVYDTLKEAELVAVVDADLPRARAVAAQHGCEALPSAGDLPGMVDAVSIAVPSSLHADTAVPLLERGVHCLVEKPFATSLEECEAMLAAAGAGDARVLVGHVERFNPAVTQLRRIVEDDHRVLALDARRMSAVSSRVTDVDVVVDLMVHDLDIVLDLVGEPVVDVAARGVHGYGTPGADHVVAILQFAGGATATLTASRVTQNQVRELQVTTDQRFLTVDYSAQELHIFRQGRIATLGGEPPDSGRYVLDVGTERVFVRRTEPLVAELAHFLDVARGSAPALVDGRQAATVLEVAWEIQRQSRRPPAHE